MYRKNKNTLYCFSPPVMIITIVVELGLALLTLFRKKSAIKNLALITLILLAIFQLAEFLVCQSYSWIDGLLASKVGFVAITLLPPLGIHIANSIAKRKHNWSTYVSYFLATVFIGYFVFVPDAITASICTGNYVIFSVGPGANMAYGIYYFTLLGCILALTTYLFVIQKNKKAKKALALLAVGALSFLIPTAIVYFLLPSASGSIPSIMCGFAVLYALILALGIVPLCKESK